MDIIDVMRRVRTAMLIYLRHMTVLVLCFFCYVTFNKGSNGILKKKIEGETTKTTSPKWPHLKKMECVKNRLLETWVKDRSSNLKLC